MKKTIIQKTAEALYKNDDATIKATYLGAKCILHKENHNVIACNPSNMCKHIILGYYNGGGIFNQKLNIERILESLVLKKDLKLI